jgi:cytochrome P450
MGAFQFCTVAKDYALHTYICIFGAFRTFEAGDPTGRTSLIDVTYRNSKKSHNAMVDALEAYFAAEYDVFNDKSNEGYVAPLTVDTAAVQRKYGFKAREIAATYVTIVHGALVNMVPTLFWCAAYVFSRPSLLARLREELIAAVVIEEKNGPEVGKQSQIVAIDADRIESCCPLLLSVFRETQRLVAIGTLHRRVVEDTVVSTSHSEGQKRSYLLKKGTSILLPVANIHRDPLIWGPTASEFDGDRFLGSQSHLPDAMATDEGRGNTLSESSSARLRKTAYFPFGGGKELCPGRHFATTEVLGTMTLLILGYDITEVDGGPLKQPMFGPSKITAATARPHPDAELKVQVGRREGWENVVWGVKDFS